MVFSVLLLHFLFVSLSFSLPSLFSSDGFVRTARCGPRAYLASSFIPGACLEPENCPHGEIELSGDCGESGKFVCCRSAPESQDRPDKRVTSQTRQGYAQDCDIGLGKTRGVCSNQDDSKLGWSELRQRYPTSNVKCSVGTKRIAGGFPCEYCCYGGRTMYELENDFQASYEVDAKQLRFDCQRHMKGTYDEFENWFANFATQCMGFGRVYGDDFRGVTEFFVAGFKAFLGINEPNEFEKDRSLAFLAPRNLPGTDTKAYAEAARRAARVMMMRWGLQSVKDDFLDKMMATIEKVARHVFMTSPQATVRSTTAEIIRENIRSFSSVTISSRPQSLRNFFYGHRSYAALGPMILRDPVEFKRYLWFVENMSKSSYVPAKDSDIARVNRYYKQLPRTIPQSTKDISSVVSAMEGNPYMAAWALLWISKRNTLSNAKKGATTWLQQPIELDIYIPPHLAARMHKGETINWSEMINREIKVGHGKTLTMISELFHAKFSEGCEVTSNSDISKFIELGTWLKVINVAIQYLSSDQNFNDQNFGTAAELLRLTRTKTSKFQSLLNIDLQLILDIKCQFEKSTPIDELVKAINDEYGVVVAGIGSFYKLPKLTHIQQGAVTEITKPPVSYQWFFSPKNLEQGLREGRIGPLATALVTASSLIKLVAGKSLDCTYARNNDALNILRRLKTQYRLNLGIWTQESQLTSAAAHFLFQLANDEGELFNIGFAVGGPHDPTLWPLNSKCSDMGGLDNFDYVPNR